MNESHEETIDEQEILEASASSIPTTAQNTEKSSPNRLAVYFILACLILERIAFYSIAANLTVSLGINYLRWSDGNTLTAELIFTGTSYFSTLIFAVVSDATLGRAKTILLGFCIYISGFSSAVVITHPVSHSFMCGSLSASSFGNTTTIFHEPCAPAVLSTIIIISLGAGAVQSNIAVLGAEQMQPSQITLRYFDKYILAVNIGAAIAKLTFALTYTRNIHYIVYVVAMVALAIAIALFLFGWEYYKHVKPYDSVLTKCIPVAINAFQTQRQYRKSKHSVVQEGVQRATSNTLNVAQYCSERNESTRTNQERLAFLDFAKALNGGKFHDRIVDDVKSLQSAIAVFISFIPYFIIYSQVNSSFPLQGQYMDKSKNSDMVTYISLADPATIIIGIFILHVFVYKCLDIRNRHILIATKFIIGLVFACITMCVAGLIETLRQIGCDNNNSNISRLSIYTQLPQYIGMGLSEIFAMVATYEFAYYAAPRSGRSLYMSVRFCLVGLSPAVSAGFMLVFPRRSTQLTFACPKNDANQWNLYTYFFSLAGLQFLCIGIFILCRKRLPISKLNLEN